MEVSERIFVKISLFKMDIKDNEKVLTVRDWIIIQIIMMIPIVNIIMWIKWLVSDKTNQNLKNFLIASLVMIVIGMIIWFLSMTFLMTSSMQ
ncbi:hypothetical protein HMPREF0202_00647 [Cetobacterium somerae ATCC BAA-474]|uniref:Uncharacterized protein n=2 Tax=Cetobacterium TaxID=180162 RepID=U7VD30_9FUSO|nr:hypothetical protein HMPREF0202_00647 [Cetobacterium somerae ATCC BAA-474]